MNALVDDDPRTPVTWRTIARVVMWSLLSCALGFAIFIAIAALWLWKLGVL